MKKVVSILLAVFLILSMDIFAFATSETEEYEAEEYINYEDGDTYLYAENLKDLSILDGDYSNLREIYLENCMVRGNEDIFASPKLKDFAFKNCIFVTGKVELPAVVNELYFNGTFPEDLSSLKKCKKLERIVLDECKMKDLTSFSDVGFIKELRFDRCAIDSIAGIEKGNEIEWLAFNDVPIEDIENLKNVKGLRYLELAQTAVRDLSPIKDLDLYFLDVCDSLMIKNFEVIMEIETLNDMSTVNCQMLYTPEIIEYLEKNDIPSHYEKGDLELKEKVLDLCRKIEKKYLTDEEKIGAVVKYACDTITYDYEVYSDENLNMEYADNILKYAFKGTGCCTTYTGLVAMMLNAMDIDCYSLSGNKHIWNLVELDGYYYWLDATWIDSDWVEYFDESSYFMVTGEEFLSEHTGFDLPPSVKNNPNSFDGVFKCKTRFKPERFDYNQDEIIEKPTLPETTTVRTTTEETTAEKTTEEVSEEVADTKETEATTAEKENIDNGKNKKMIVVIPVSIVAFGAIVAIVIVIMKKRNRTQ